jgi:hypothetical protein
MKKQLILLYACSALFLVACEAEYVATVPEEQVVVRTEPPFVGAVWIDNEWRWDHRHYVVVPAHWDHPRGTWHRGSWKKSRRGYTWRRGYWR